MPGLCLRIFAWTMSTDWESAPSHSFSPGQIPLYSDLQLNVTSFDRPYLTYVDQAIFHAIGSHCILGFSLQPIRKNNKGILGGKQEPKSQNMNVFEGQGRQLSNQGAQGLSRR